MATATIATPAPTLPAAPLSWKYYSLSGQILAPSGAYLGTGYAGNGKGLNNPDLQYLHNIGPIPRGAWDIGEFFDDEEGKGPVVAHLEPCDGTETYGRSGFMIHGDTAAANHTASEGCIVAPRFIRDAIRLSPVKLLTVL